MEWLASIGNNWIMTAMWVAGLSVVFGVLVTLMPCNRGMYWWTDLRAAAADFMYWFILPIAVRMARGYMLIAGLILFCGGRDPDVLPVRHLPLWQQVALMLLIEDVILYWLHRLFHVGWAWKVHAIHHSPKVLDWMSTGRFHPINSLLEFGLVDTIVLLLGFSVEAFQVLVVFNLLYSSMVHANLNWTFGPLRFVLASPVFHRWHHTTEEAGLNKNFASTLPVLDVMFGTFYMPAGELPKDFGTGDAAVPEGFWAQLVYPFRRMKSVRVKIAEAQPKQQRRRRAPTWKRMEREGVSV